MQRRDTRFFRHVRLLLPLLIMHATLVHAQQSAEAGIVVSYRFGIPLELLRTAGHVNGLQAGGTGSSYSNIFGAGLHAAFASLLSERVGIDMSAELLASVSRFRSATYAGDRELDPVTQQIVASQYQSRISSTITSFDAQVRACYSLAPRMRFSLGVWITPQLAATYTYTLRKLAPLVPNSTPADSVLPVSSAAEPPSAMRYGLGTGGSIELPVGAGILRPELGARLDLPALADGLGIRSLSVRASVAWSFVRRRRADTIQPPPAPPVVARADDISARVTSVPFNATDPAVGHETRESALKPRLVATIDLFSPADGNARLQTAQVRPEIVQHQLWMAFPGLIYCDASDNGIPERYMPLTQDRAATFTPGDLARRAPAEIYCHVLDILGYRMRRNPSAAATLVGNRSADESDGVARSRAEAARAYLRDVWGIAPERIAVKLGHGYRMGEERVDRCVVIEGPASTLLAPIVVEWRARGFRLPSLDIDPEIDAQSGVRRWAIAVRQEGHVVTSYSSSDTVQGNTEIRLAIPEDYAGSMLPPLVAEMTVEDSTGQTRTVRDTLPLLLGTGASDFAAAPVDRNSRLYVLPDGSERRNRLREIAAGVRDGESITIRGTEAAEIAAALRSIVDLRHRNIMWSVDASDTGIAGAPTVEEHHVNECGLVELVASRSTGGTNGR